MSKRKIQMLPENGDFMQRCRLCEQTFRSVVATLMHKEKFAGVCICYKIYRNECEYEQHFQNPEFPYDYKCCICGYLFNEKDHLKNHFMQHGGWRKYTCPYCRREFPEFEQLANHEIENSDEPEYECNTCHIIFSRKCALLEHEFISKSGVLERLSNAFPTTNHQMEIKRETPSLTHRIPSNFEFQQSKGPWILPQEQPSSTLYKPLYTQTYPLNTEIILNNTEKHLLLTGQQSIHPQNKDFGLRLLQPQQIKENAVENVSQQIVPNRSEDSQLCYLESKKWMAKFTELYYKYMGNHKALIPA